MMCALPDGTQRYFCRRALVSQRIGSTSSKTEFEGRPTFSMIEDTAGFSLLVSPIQGLSEQLSALGYCYRVQPWLSDRTWRAGILSQVGEAHPGIILRITP